MLKPTPKKRIPIFLAIAVFMQMLDMSILNTALPTIAADLQEPAFNMYLAVVSYTLTIALLMPLSSYLADRFGTKNIFIGAIIFFSLGSLLCAWSNSLTMLTGARIIQGVGGSMLTPVARLAIMRGLDKKEWLNAINLAITPALVGQIIGPLLGGYIAEFLTWQWIFLINLPFGGLGIIIGCKLLPNYKNSDYTTDWLGFLLFAGAAFSITLVLELVGKSYSYMLLASLLVLFLILVLSYFIHAKHNQEALFPNSLFYIRTFRVGILGNIFSRLCLSSITLLLPMLLQLVFNYSPAVSGWFLAPMALAAIITKPFIPSILQRYGYRRTLIVNTTIVAGTLVVLCWPDETTFWLYLLPLLLLMGIVNTIQYSTMNTITLADLTTTNRSSGNSLALVNQQFSITLGISCGANILNIFTQQISPHQQIQLAFQLTFLLLALFTLLSVIIFCQLKDNDGDVLANRS